MASSPLGRLEFRQGHFRRDIFEHCLYRHTHRHFFPWAADDVADDMYASVSAVDGDMCDDIRNVGLEGGYRCVVHHDEGFNLAGLRQTRPFKVPRITLGTKSLGRPAKAL